MSLSFLICSFDMFWSIGPLKSKFWYLTSLTSLYYPITLAWEIWLFIIFKRSVNFSKIEKQWLPLLDPPCGSEAPWLLILDFSWCSYCFAFIFRIFWAFLSLPGDVLWCDLVVHSFHDGFRGPLDSEHQSPSVSGSFSCVTSLQIPSVWACFLPPLRDVYYYDKHHETSYLASSKHLIELLGFTYLRACMHVIRGQKRTSNPLQLQLQVVERLRLDAENQTWDFCKSSKLSLTTEPPLQFVFIFLSFFCFLSFVDVVVVVLNLFLFIALCLLFIKRTRFVLTLPEFTMSQVSLAPLFSISRPTSHCPKSVVLRSWIN